MHPGGAYEFGELVPETAALLAEAYRRFARLRLASDAALPLPSTEALDTTAEPSLHELTLTRQRKESTRS